MADKVRLPLSILEDFLGELKEDPDDREVVYTTELGNVITISKLTTKDGKGVIEIELNPGD